MSDNTRKPDLFNDLGIDVEAANRGRWIDDFPARGFRWKMARAGNPDYQRIFGEQLEELREKAADSGEIITNEQSEQAMMYACAHAVVVDWEPFDFDGETLEYSPDTALRILSDPSMAEVWSRVWRKANSLEDYRASRVKRDAKN